MKKHVEIRVINQDDEIIYSPNTSDRNIRIDGTMYPIIGDELYIDDQKYIMTNISIGLKTSSDTVLIHITVK